MSHNLDKWDLISQENPYKFIGFIPYEKYDVDIKSLQDQVKSLQDQLESYKKQKPKYRNIKAYKDQEMYIVKVMEDIKVMKLLSTNEHVDVNLKQFLVWIDNDILRKKELAKLYNKLKQSQLKKNKTKIYLAYKKLSIWSLMYRQKYERLRIIIPNFIWI